MHTSPASKDHGSRIESLSRSVKQSNSWLCFPRAAGYDEWLALAKLVESRFSYPVIYILRQ